MPSRARAAPEADVSMTAETLARRVKRLREARGLTQEQLVGAAGLSICALTQIEQGKTADPRLSTLRKLAAALGVRVCVLLGEDAPDAGPCRA
jgi:transcriptional regulator with XRE-family HTH domain